MNTLKRVCLLGFGEVGTTLAQNLADVDVQLSTYDVLFADEKSAPSRASERLAHVRACSSVEDAVRGSQLVISAVTADQCHPASKLAARSLEEGAWFLDLNSVSPGTRRQAAAVIEAAGGRYVECAVISPIQPLGIAAPMLLGGSNADAFQAVVTELGFSNNRVISTQLGKASAAKMCRSVIVKGMEALVTESLLSARHYGVESVVIESLQDLLPGVNWEDHARYLISRSLRHGTRRAEEMRQVVATLEEAHVEPLMSSACVFSQERAPEYVDAVEEPELAAMLDQMLSMQSSESTNEEKQNAHH